MADAAREIFDLRKQMRFGEALELARKAFVGNSDDIYLQRAYGWVIYDHLKHDVGEWEAEKLSPSRIASHVANWVTEYRQLDQIERPGMLHSCVMIQLVKVDRVWPGFLEFVRWWDPQALREEDKVPYDKGDGRPAPSLQLRLLYAIGRAAVGAVHDEALREWAEGEVGEGLSRFPDDPWLHYYQSQLLLAHGRVEEARHCLLPVVKRQREAGWVWSLLGHTFERDVPHKAITCFYRAVQLARKPSEILNTRVSLARLLAAAERFPEAAVQVRAASMVREEAGWRIPDDLAQLLRADWFRQLADRQSLPKEPDVAEAADEILFGGEHGEIQTRIGVIDHHNSEKALTHVAFSPHEGAVLRQHRFRNIAELPVGAFVEVAIAGDPPRPFRAKRIEEQTIPGFCEEFAGTLFRRNGQPFGFVSTAENVRVFVPPDLLGRHPMAAGARVRCRALLGEDKKRGTPSWKAVQMIADG